MRAQDAALCYRPGDSGSMTQDGRRAQGERSGDLAAIDVSARRDVKRIKRGRGAAGILMRPDGSRVSVACSHG